MGGLPNPSLFERGRGPPRSGGRVRGFTAGRRVPVWSLQIEGYAERRRALMAYCLVKAHVHLDQRPKIPKPNSVGEASFERDGQVDFQRLGELGRNGFRSRIES